MQTPAVLSCGLRQISTVHTGVCVFVNVRFLEEAFEKGGGKMKLWFLQ